MRPLALLPVAAIAVAFGACVEVDPVLGECPTGARDCPCTAGNGCDPGLFCELGRCVGPGGPEETGSFDDSAGVDDGSDTDDDGDDGDDGVLPIDDPQWVPVNPPTNPPPRTGNEMVWDPAREVIVMYGGGDAGFFADTWEFDGLDWTQRAMGGPPAVASHGLAFHPPSGETVLFGGALEASQDNDETWLWNGESWVWLDTPTRPPGRTARAMAFTTVNSRVVLFGGSGEGGSLADTWAFDGSDWQLLSPPTSPSPRSGARMAPDPLGRGLILFGGDPQGETWLFEGTDWTLLDLPGGPPPRSSGVMAYAPSHGVVVLFSGVDLSGANPLSDTWAFDGDGWFELFPSVVPPPVNSGAMAFDGNDDRLILFGGLSEGLDQGDTWALEL